MSFTILEFFLFLLLTLVVYYLLPKKFRWIWLLIVSLVYYVSFGVKKIVFVLWQTMVVYLATRLIDKQARQGKAYLASHKADMSSEEKKAYKAKLKKKRRLQSSLCRLQPLSACVESNIQILLFLMSIF